MSKIDAQRAMWKQRYERRQAAAAAQPASAAPGTTAAPLAAPQFAEPEFAEPELTEPGPTEPGPTEPVIEPAEELCGHRNMGGRTCTRERGHTAKSHRYS